MQTSFSAALTVLMAMQSLPLQAAVAPATTNHATNRDVRCLMLSNLFSKAATAAPARESANQARIFYLGRVSDKYTPARLETAMSAEAKTIVAASAGTDMNKCVASIQAAAEAVETAGRKAAAGGGLGAAGPGAAPAGPPAPSPAAAR